MTAAGGKTAAAAVVEVRGSRAGGAAEDRLAVEAPLELRVRGAGGGEAGAARRLAITMRTPGEDAELAVGFLFTEGIVRTGDEVLAVAANDGDAAGSVVVTLAERALARAEGKGRPFAVTSACGVCGGAGSLAEIAATPEREVRGGEPLVEPAVVHRLPELLRAGQPGFAATGGQHAAGLFDAAGVLLRSREDVGRHNAVDKLVGSLLLGDGALPAERCLLLVSGRASFELVQKARMAGIPVLAAVGAPSSLAVELARQAGMTLLGFVRGGRFNVYCGGERLRMGG